MVLSQEEKAKVLDYLLHSNIDLGDFKLDVSITLRENIQRAIRYSAAKYAAQLRVRLTDGGLAKIEGGSNTAIGK